MFLSRRTCLAMGLALGLTACFGGGSPFSVVKDFYAAVLQGDADKAITFLALKQVSANEMQLVKPKVQMIVAQGKSKTDANGGLDAIELLQENISEDGEQAKVEVKVLFKNGKSSNESFKLVKEDGAWKIRL